MKRNKNSVVRAFERAFIQELKNAGVEPCGVVSYCEEVPQFCIETRAGKYTFAHECQLGDKPLNFIGVYGRFENPALAKEFVYCNPFNGKFNFDGIGYVPTEQDAIEHAQAIARYILSLRPIP